MPHTGQIHYASKGRGAGQWWPSGNTATFYCPTCAAVHTLQEFKISDSGNVTPSFVCSYHDRDTCFHDNVHLVDWRAPP